MAHFAKLGLNGKVLEVQALSNNIATTEQAGVNFLSEQSNWIIWVQCSYNTQKGIHLLGGTPFRKNYPGIGFKYDEDRDAFIPPKPNLFPSWIIDEDTCTWKAPVEKPTDEQKYIWNESTQEWTLVDNSEVDNSEE